MHSLPTQAPRLWRCRGKGSKYVQPTGAMAYKVFVTFSWKAAEMIRKGEIIVNK